MNTDNTTKNLKILNKTTQKAELLIDDNGNVVNIANTYDTTNNSLNVVNQNLDSTNFTQPQHVIEATNKAVGTYRVEVSAIDYISASFHLSCTGGTTMKLYATNNGDADTTSTTGWVDVSSTILGSSSITDTDAYAVTDTDWKPLKYMIEYETTSSTNTIDTWVILYN